jgi:hypothetical protein
MSDFLEYGWNFVQGSGRVYKNSITFIKKKNAPEMKTFPVHKKIPTCRQAHNSDPIVDRGVLYSCFCLPLKGGLA